jgi:hypothetical protein
VRVLTLQAILITSSLLLVLAMVGSLMLLSIVRARVEPEVAPVEPADSPL